MLAHPVGFKCLCANYTLWSRDKVTQPSHYQCVIAVRKKTLDGIVFQTDPVVDMVQFGKPRTKSTISLSFGFRFGPSKSIFLHNSGSLQIFRLRHEPKCPIGRNSTLLRVAHFCFSQTGEIWPVIATITSRPHTETTQPRLPASKLKRQCGYMVN